MSHRSLPLVLFLVALPLGAEAPPLLPVPAAAALAEEISGELAKRNLELIVRQHRLRGSRGYAEAAQFVAGELRRYGLAEVEVVAIPADGETFYGTQRSRRPWDADFAELWELRREGSSGGSEEAGSARWTRSRRLASWEAVPLSLAQDSESGDVEADLVDVGAGTAEADYAGREVRGRLVLTSSQPEAVVPLAVERHGAAGIVSYAQNQRTAWWGDDATLVRWGHAGSFNRVPTFAFMVSLGTARDFQARLRREETVRLHAVVRAGQHAGAYQVVTAIIPGADAARRGEELTFSCHLDHPRPGANATPALRTTLEVARASPSSWPRSGWRGRRAHCASSSRRVEGTMALLHHVTEIASRARVAIHLDMVGAGRHQRGSTSPRPRQPAVVRARRARRWALGPTRDRRLRRERPRRLAAGSPPRAARSRCCGLSEYTAAATTTSGTRAPSACRRLLQRLADRYIHTTGDTAANIDPTKLERAAFLAAASALVLADLDGERAAAAARYSRREPAAPRHPGRARAGLPASEAAALARFWSWHEREVPRLAGPFRRGQRGAARRPPPTPTPRGSSPSGSAC